MGSRSPAALSPRKKMVSTEGRSISTNLANYRVCRWNEKGTETDLTVSPRTKVIRPFIVVQRVICAVSCFRIPSYVADNRISARIPRATTARKHNAVWFTNHVQLIFMTRHGLGHVIV
jgi:hypothetical protein